MRVITGKAKGRALKGPPDIGTRPMLDRVKESLFSILEGYGAFEGRALDLFAGTGSLGIEALSRGAEWCDFVEARSQAASVVRENLERTKLASQAKVWVMPVERYIASIKGQAKYAIILLDPPYAMAGIPELMTSIGTADIIAPEGIVVLGHWPKLVLPEHLGSLELLKHRRIGDSCFSIYEPSVPPQVEPHL